MNILKYDLFHKLLQRTERRIVYILHKILISEYDYLTNKFELNLEGTESLNKNLNGNNISFSYKVNLNYQYYNF